MVLRSEAAPNETLGLWHFGIPMRQEHPPQHNRRECGQQNGIPAVETERLARQVDYRLDQWQQEGRTQVSQDVIAEEENDNQCRDS